MYPHLPSGLQHATVSLYGYWWRQKRQGGGYRNHVREFAAREEWSADRWRNWQENRLRHVLAVALYAPHYANTWSRLGISARETATFQLSDLEQLPVLGKDDVRRNPQLFCPGGRAGKGALAWETSGSTGTPLTTYHSSDDLRRGLALREARYLSFAGVGHAMPRATFGGRAVETRPRTSGPFHRYNLAERQLYFSAYHLSAATVGEYASALRRYAPVWLTGYASTIGELARLARAADVECPSVSAVITTSEPVSEQLRVRVRDVFGCRVTEEYGLAEEVCFALECERGALHVSPDAGIVEVLDEQGGSCPPGVTGDIVATGLLREAQPLIRYRTGDLGAWAEHSCACGRAMPVLAGIEGRVDDAVITPDGRHVSRLTAVARGLPEIDFMQFIQDAPGRLDVRVVTHAPLDARLESEIRARLEARLGPEMTVEIWRADAPLRTTRGKVRSVINNVERKPS